MSDEELRTEEPVEGPPEPPPEVKPEPPPDVAEKAGDWEDEKDEKGDGWGRDPIGSITWALILISVGLIFLAENTLHLFSFERFGGAWNLIFLAVGVVLLFEVALRLLLPAYRRPLSGTLTFAFIMLALGAVGILGWSVTWPVFVIAIGLGMLISGLLRWR